MLTIPTVLRQVFNQYSLTCDHRETALPCEYAPQFFELNKRIQEGRPDVLLHTEADVARLESVLLSRKGN